MKFPFKPPIRDPELLERAQAVFDLHEAARVIQEGNLRRRFPKENEEQIANRLRNWVIYRTEDGDPPETS